VNKKRRFSETVLIIAADHQFTKITLVRSSMHPRLNPLRDPSKKDLLLDQYLSSNLKRSQTLPSSDPRILEQQPQLLDKVHRHHSEEV